MALAHSSGLGPLGPNLTSKEKEEPMKKFALLLSLVFVAGVAVAQETKTAPPAKAKAEAEATKAQAPADQPAAKTHDVAAEIVSVDAVKHTITVKGDKENATFPVEGKAVGSLKMMKAGEKVTLTCKDDEKGAHKSVVAIKAAAPAKAPEPK